MTQDNHKIYFVLRELRILKAISNAGGHENIVNFKDSFFMDKYLIVCFSWFFLMNCLLTFKVVFDYNKAGSLDCIYKRLGRPFSEEQIILICFQVLKVLFSGIFVITLSLILLFLLIAVMLIYSLGTRIFEYSSWSSSQRYQRR